MKSLSTFLLQPIFFIFLASYFFFSKELSQFFLSGKRRRMRKEAERAEKKFWERFDQRISRKLLVSFSTCETFSLLNFSVYEIFFQDGHQVKSSDFSYWVTCLMWTRTTKWLGWEIEFIFWIITAVVVSTVGSWLRGPGFDSSCLQTVRKFLSLEQKYP